MHYFHLSKKKHSNSEPSRSVISAPSSVNSAAASFHFTPVGVGLERINSSVSRVTGCAVGCVAYCGDNGSDHEPGNVICPRSEEHTSELQSLMRISYAVFFLTKKRTKH